MRLTTLNHEQTNGSCAYHPQFFLKAQVDRDGSGTINVQERNDEKIERKVSGENTSVGCFCYIFTT